MGNKIIRFNKVGYDPFIDFIKAYAIICVLIGHTFPNLDNIGYGLWAGMQVPLFILVQTFHSFKKNTSSFSLIKTFWRILLPFTLVQIGTYIFLIIFNPNITIKSIIYRILLEGGIGPGSYYPWIYLQIAFLLPLIKKHITNKSTIKLTFIALVICEGLELISSLINLSDSLYRLLAIRYFFLLYLGWIWVKKGIVINIKTLFISILSLATIIYFEYFSVNDEPFFFNTVWKFHRWPCYYYVSTLGCYLLYFIYQTISQFQFVNNATILLAKYSYEIFLMQMSIIAIYPSLDFITNEFLCLFLKITSIFFLSIAGGYLFNNYYNKLLAKFNF